MIKNFIKEIKENWKTYFVFVLLVCVHSLIFKIDTTYSMLILGGSFLTSSFIFGAIALKKSKN